MVKWQRVLYQPNLPLGKDGERVTACRAHRELSKEAAKEGMVLLKNEDRVLPLKPGAKVALFGKAAFDYVKGGGGSGDVTVEYVRNLYDGFADLSDRVSVYEELASFYRENVKKQYAEGALPGLTKEPELPEELYRGARNYADTAVISICRFSGEGWDRKSEYGGDENPDQMKELQWASKLFPDGDFYLADEEKAMVERVKELFPRIVVVLNVGGMVDTTWFAGEKRIQSVLLAWQGGMEGGLAAAELLCGLGNPSGKLSDTFAVRLEDYPSSVDFHESRDYVPYTDDIFVGYRYFETMSEAREKVNYPFGFGLSYTTFSREILTASLDDAEDVKLQVTVRVTNTGSMAGKEVLQLYGSSPQGVLAKPAWVLMEFQKTRLLAPGESQILQLCAQVDTLASYDDVGKLQKSAYVLEKGVYRFALGNSVRDTSLLSVEYLSSNDRIVEQLSEKMAPGAMEDKEEPLPPVPNESFDGIRPSVREVPGWHIWKNLVKENARSFAEAAEGKMTVREFMGQLSDEELAHLLGGQPNTGVANTFGIGNMPEYGVPNIMTADGPAGLRIEKPCGINTTAWPCATLLACTWNPEIVREVGAAGAKEVKENNIAVWLTPAINIHRSPLCGRNFEYYSEDPLLTGRMAAAMVEGIQSQRIGATVKHFACNNKETNRRESDSRVSERALREIYLKAFEIVVKTAHPWCIMTSYNRINGCRTSENRDLIDGILRGEWGFDGLVMTDWWNLGDHYKEVLAGNDVKMPRGLPDRLMDARAQGLLGREDLERSAERVLELILRID